MNWFKNPLFKDKLKVGDWVNSYYKGIHRIEKIYDCYYDESDSTILGDNKIGDKLAKTIVSKRFLNSKSQKSISYDWCNETFVKQISVEQKELLDKFIKDNLNSLKEFENYEIPNLETIYNMPLQIDSKEELSLVNQLITFVQNGKSFLEIEKEMERLDILRLKPKYFGNYVFQLINYNEEYLNKRKIWRKAILNSNEK